MKVLQMPCKFIMFFLEYLRILGTENTAGGASTWPRGWRARPHPLGAPPCLVGPWWAPSLISSSHIITYLQKKNPHPAQARVLTHFAAIFELLAQSSIHKTALGGCCLVCDSYIGPISFCSSALFIANFCCVGDHVPELAC